MCDENSGPPGEPCMLLAPVEQPLHPGQEGAVGVVGVEHDAKTP